jgi:hypothetical protein
MGWEEANWVVAGGEGEEQPKSKRPQPWFFYGINFLKIQIF